MDDLSGLVRQGYACKDWPRLGSPAGGLAGSCRRNRDAQLVSWHSRPPRSLKDGWMAPGPAVIRSSVHRCIDLLGL